MNFVSRIEMFIFWIAKVVKIRVLAYRGYKSYNLNNNKEDNKIMMHQ